MKYLLSALLTFAAQGPIDLSHYEFMQHDVRTNRVWTLHILFQACGVTLTRGYIADINAEGDVSNWRDVPADRIFIQWTKEVPVGPTTYGIGDLLADYGQEIHLIRVLGYVGTPDHGFAKLMWVSPAGISFERIPRAPIRDSRYDRGKWNEDEMLALSNWITRHHQWANEKWLTEFQGLLWRMDKRVEVPMKIKTPGCMQTGVNILPSMEGTSYGYSQAIALI